MNKKCLVIVNGVIFSGFFMSPGIGQAADLVESPVVAEFYGDLRFGAYIIRKADRDGSKVDTDDVRGRVRLGVAFQKEKTLSGRVRLAGRYSDEQEVISFEVNDHNPARSFGISTLDEANLTYRSGKNWLRFGRMQTKFELEGVAKKSLDRNNSPNVDIDFTDGIYFKRDHGNKWKSHFIVQHNPEEGPTDVLRPPLDVSEEADLTLFYGLEMKNKIKASGFTQIGAGLTVIPDGLLVDGTLAGERDNYFGIVGRFAYQRALQGGRRLLLAGALSHAPNTPQESALGIGGSKQSGGNAFQASINWLDFTPNHSAGVVLGIAQGGWLLSPDFRNNERLIEGRYKWQMTKKWRVETRIRQRKELEQRTTATQKRDERDFYLRFTYKI